MGSFGFIQVPAFSLPVGSAVLFNYFCNYMGAIPLSQSSTYLRSLDGLIPKFQRSSAMRFGSSF